MTGKKKVKKGKWLTYKKTCPHVWGSKTVSKKKKKKGMSKRERWRKTCLGHR